MRGLTVFQPVIQIFIRVMVPILLSSCLFLNNTRRICLDLSGHTDNLKLGSTRGAQQNSGQSQQSSYAHKHSGLT